MKRRVLNKIEREHKLYSAGEIHDIRLVEHGKKFFIMHFNDQEKVVYSLTKYYTDKDKATKRFKEYISSPNFEEP